MPETTLAVENVTVGYGSGHLRVKALSDVSLDFSPGSLTVVMGPSGSGKTTLLSLLGCLLNPDDGRVLVNGTNVSSLNERRRTEIRGRQIGYIFQAFRLFHSLTAIENVMLSGEIAGSHGETAPSAALLLERLGLKDKFDLKPNALSGGEKQRVAIARALLPNPNILLADEPTASLDSAAGQQICEILRDLADNHHQTVVVVSHDSRWNQYAHRTVVLEDGHLVDNRSILQ